MADASASLDRASLRKAADDPPAGLPGHAGAVAGASEEAISAYAAFCRSALFAPAQSPSWVRHWIGQVRPDAVVATLEAGGRPVLALALEIARSGPFRIARLAGGRHANGNFAAADPAWLKTATAPALRPLFDAVKAARPDVDLIALQRLLPDLGGIANPFAGLPGFTSPNVSLAAGLEGGFEALLTRTSGKRKRKKHRSQSRRFEAAGGFRRVRARTPEEVRALLDAFFAMKESRFRRMGIPDVFGEPEVRRFFHRLFAEALGEERPPFVLHGLEVAGTLRAVTGSSLCGDRLICEFGAIAEDDLAHASPGDFLFFENIREACKDGFGVYDFSVGDEPYKRLWCDIETRHRDVLVPLTLKGRALACGLAGNERLKTLVKSSPAAWRLARALRRRAAGGLRRPPLPPAGD